MALRPMHDLVIFLLGIMGSVLTKHGRALWSPSPRTISRVLQLKQLVSDLTLDGDDPHLPALDDGVLATELMPDAHLIPGFWKMMRISSLSPTTGVVITGRMRGVWRRSSSASLLRGAPPPAMQRRR